MVVFAVSCAVTRDAVIPAPADTSAHVIIHAQCAFFIVIVPPTRGGLEGAYVRTDG
jgi:hypothetical protein